MNAIIKNNRAVALIELLTSICIILIFAALIMTSIKTAREKSLQTQCLNNERQLICAVLMFSFDESRFPEALASLKSRYPDTVECDKKYFGAVAYAETNPTGYYNNYSALLNCPKAADEGLSVSYGYNVYLRGVNYSVADNSSDVVVLADSNKQFLLSANDSVKRHRNGLNAAFLDGHVSFVKDIFPYPFSFGDEEDGQDSGVEEDQDEEDTGGDVGLNEGVDVNDGKININPSNSSDSSFKLEYLDLVQITRDDLHADRELQYVGQVTYLRVKPTGPAQDNYLQIGSETFCLSIGKTYEITSNDLSLHLYNDKADTKGKAVGQWWLDSIQGTNVIIKEI